jgi:hypothetical protein
MTTKYDHLLPPELPRNRKRVDSFPDLDCYPDRYEGVRNLAAVPCVLLEVAFGVVDLPRVLFVAFKETIFTKE